MEPNDQNKLHLKRELLQHKLRVQEEVKRSIAHWIELYDYILKHNLAHRLSSLARVGEQDLPLWIDTLSKEYGTYHFSKELLKEQPWKSKLQQLDHLYPNQHILRYVPSLPLLSTAYNDPQDGLEKCINALQLENQQVYLYYLPYTPIVEISLATLLEHADNFFYLGLDEAVIIPEKLDWMIFYSMEEEWYAGRHPL